MPPGVTPPLRVAVSWIGLPIAAFVAVVEIVGAAAETCEVSPLALQGEATALLLASPE